MIRYRIIEGEDYDRTLGIGAEQRFGRYTLSVRIWKVWPFVQVRLFRRRPGKRRRTASDVRS